MSRSYPCTRGSGRSARSATATKSFPVAHQTVVEGLPARLGVVPGSGSDRLGRLSLRVLFDGRFGGGGSGFGRDGFDDSCLFAGRVLPCCVRRPGLDGPQIRSGSRMYLPELCELVFTDTGALGQQALEHLRLATEHCDLLHQHAVPVKGLAKGRAQCHRVAIVPRPLAQLVPRFKYLAALGRECVDRRAVAPAVDRMADLRRDAHERVVVRSRKAGSGRFLRAHRRQPSCVVPADRLPPFPMPARAASLASRHAPSET